MGEVVITSAGPVGERELATRIETVLGLDPSAPAVEYHDIWYSWGALADIANDVAERLRGLRPGRDVRGMPVALVMRNDPAVLAAMLGTFLAGARVVTVSPSHGDAGLQAELAGLRPPVVIAVERDWARPGLRVGASGARGLLVDADRRSVSLVDGFEDTGAGPFGSDLPGVAVEMLTSGTTGPPKRVPLDYPSLARAVFAAEKHYTSRAPDEVRLSRGVAIVSSPFVHMSGLFRSLLNVCQGRRIVLMDKFRVPEFVALVARHRPRALSLVPAALGMVLDADVPADSFAGVDVVTSGTSHLPTDVQERFESRFGVAVLPSYGATEFAGGVAGWTLPLHRQWSAAKRGSVGRPQNGREVRIVAADSGEPVAPGQSGLVEVRTAGKDWVRTTDLGRVDADGFLFIDGRADDVILRGGFKITPAVVARVLREHPDVRDAGVTGMPDPRLGAVPVAAVEVRDGASVTADELLAFARERLAPYQVPTLLLIVDELPRTPSMKVNQPALRELIRQRGVGEPSDPVS
jgi:acyl-CoA synthetase (AMP-forming)/AMP-acid ligase II